jgi:hypothetical protein
LKQETVDVFAVAAIAAGPRLAGQEHFVHGKVSVLEGFPINTILSDFILDLPFGNAQNPCRLSLVPPGIPKGLFYNIALKAGHYLVQILLNVCGHMAPCRNTPALYIAMCMPWRISNEIPDSGA